MYNKGRVYSKFVLPKGSEVEVHTHTGDFEFVVQHQSRSVLKVFRAKALETDSEIIVTEPRIIQNSMVWAAPPLPTGILA